MWEVMERRIPFETNQDFPDQMMCAIAEIRGGARPAIGPGCEEFGEGLIGLLVRSWSGQADQRPSFGEIVEDLCVLKQNVGDRCVSIDERLVGDKR